MTNEETITRLKNIDISDALQEDYDALFTAIDSFKLILNLTDRPCPVCKFNIKNGLCNSCSKWKCPFDDVLKGEEGKP